MLHTQPPVVMAALLAPGCGGDKDPGAGAAVWGGWTEGDKQEGDAFVSFRKEESGRGAAGSCWQRAGGGVLGEPARPQTPPARSQTPLARPQTPGQASDPPGQGKRSASQGRTGRKRLRL